VCSECTCRSGSSGYGDTIYYTSDRDSHSLSDNEEPSDVDDDTDDDDEAGPGWLDGGPGQGLSLAPGTAPGRGGGNPTDSPGPSNTQGCHAPYKALCAGLTGPLAPASGTCPTYMWVQECQRLAVAAAASLSCMETGLNSLPPPPAPLGLGGTSPERASDPESDRPPPQPPPQEGLQFHSSYLVPSRRSPRSLSSPPAFGGAFPFGTSHPEPGRPPPKPPPKGRAITG